MARPAKVSKNDSRHYSDVAGSVNANLVMNEVDLCLLEAQIPLKNAKEMNDPLQWWKEHEAKYPHLSRMARQYLAPPATSAGVERLFSQAGRMFDDLSHAMAEGTLQHALFASNNYEMSKDDFKEVKLVSKKLQDVEPVILATPIKQPVVSDEELTSQHAAVETARPSPDGIETVGLSPPCGSEDSELVQIH